MNQDTGIERQYLGAYGSQVQINVEGRPRTKGSLKPVHMRMGPGRCKVSLTEDGKFSTPWKDAMIREIRRTCVVERYAGAVVIDMSFRFDRLCGEDEALEWPTRQGGEYGHGDEDKLRRNVLDALTQSGLILDDSNSIGGTTYKRWAHEGESCGVLIRVRPAEPRDLVRIRDLEAGIW